MFLNSILSDSSKFKIVFDELFNVLIKKEDKINRLLMKLKKNNEISDDEYSHMHVSGTKPGILYGLPKIHKCDVPLRPILSAIGTAGYNLAKFFVPLLSAFTTNHFSIKDSFSFASEISSLPDSNSYFMASFDIKSLFTNIPLEEPVSIATENYFNINSPSRNFTPKLFKDLLLSSVKDIIFLFNGKVFSQVDGVGMGNPLGPTFANLFLCHHEKNWLDKCPLHFKPKFYRRYVDDTFILFSDPSHIPLFLNYLNSQHPNIKFTCENEAENQLNFLDVTVYRKDNKFETSVYRKPTFTGLGLRYDSFVPKSYKINLISCLIHRAYEISSNWTNFQRDIVYLRQFFSSNFYPQFLFDNVLSKYLNSTFCPKLPVMSVPKLPIFITLPYIGNSSNHCKKQLLNIVNKYFPQVNLRCIFVNRNTVGSLFPFKDQIPLMMSSNIIYKYSCSQCQSTYIGETQRHLISRSCEHKGISPRTSMPFSNPPFSNIREHALSFDHPIKVDNFSVLARCPSHDLRLLESIFIHKFSPNLNNQASSFPLQILS